MKNDAHCQPGPPSYESHYLTPPTPVFSTRPIGSLSVDEVCTLLTNLQFPEYVAKFRALPVRCLDW